MNTKINLILVAFAVAVFAGSFSLLNIYKKAEKLKETEKSPIPVSAEIFDTCRTEEERKFSSLENCYSKELQEVSMEFGHVFAFDVLNALQGRDPSANGCHFIAHGIGYGAYDKNPGTWQYLINNINPSCSYGAIHGVIEKYVASLPGGKMSEEVVPTLCGPTPRADCNHIVGHLVLVEAEGDIRKALNICKVFTDPAQLYFCQGGVFMEEITALNLIKHGIADESWNNWPARLPELEAMCRAQNASEAVPCWEEIIHAALVKLNNDPIKMFDMCNTAQVAEGARKCKRHSLGVIAATVGFDVEKVKHACKIKQPANDPAFEGDCYVYLAASAMASVPKEKPKVLEFCRGLDSEKFRASCLNEVAKFSPGVSGGPARLD